MEGTARVVRMEQSQKSADNAVIDDLENAKMQVLNSNACTATLNMQNFGNADYQHREDVIADATAVDGTFESMTVDADGATVPMNALIHQDRQFLQVDTICDNGDIYLTATNSQPLTYMVSHPHELGVSTGSQMTVSHEVGSKGEETSESSGILLDHTYEQSGEKLKDSVELLVHKDNTLAPANPVRTELVPPAMTNPADNQSFKTVTVTLLNENEAYPEQTSYILLVSNDGDGMTEDTSGDVLSITEHKTSTPSTSKSLLPVQKASDTERGACSFCEYTSTQRHLLQKHIRSHSEFRPHKCPLCGNGFKTIGALTNHINTHSGKRPHKCRCCESAFTTSGELIRHIRYKHTFEKPHKCPQCDYAAVELSKMKRHIRTHTGERPYQCTQCSYASPDSYKLKRHMRTHTGEKPYACDMCSLRFTQSNSLKAHRRIHLGSKPVFQCELCPATCGRKTDLRIHMRKLHSQESVPLECRKCHRTFDNRYSYKLHLRSHDGEHTFACSHCAFATLMERKLVDHLLLQHETHRPYKCMEDSCEALFRFKSLLRRHKIFVHGTENFQSLHKAYDCTCGKKFAVHTNQLKHQELHAAYAVLPTTLSILQDIEDADDVGEDLVAEVSEEILASNPETKDKRETTLAPLLTRRKYVDTEDNILRHRMKEFDDGDNLVMRRVVKEVKGHRVVVMEVGPSEIDNLSDDDGSMQGVDDESMLDECQNSRISGQEFVSGASMTHDAAEILYTLAVESQNHDMSDHRTDAELTASLTSSDRIVTLELDALPDNVMSEAVAGASESCGLGEHVHESNLHHQMALVDQNTSVHDTSPSLIMKCGVIEEQI